MPKNGPCVPPDRLHVGGVYAIVLLRTSRLNSVGSITNVVPLLWLVIAKYLKDSILIIIIK